MVSTKPLPCLHLMLYPLGPSPVGSCPRTWLVGTELPGWSVGRMWPVLWYSGNGSKDWNELCENDTLFFYITLVFLYDTIFLHHISFLWKHLVPIFYVLFSNRKLYIRDNAQTVTPYNAKYLIQNECLKTNTEELSESRKLWVISKCSGITQVLPPGL